MRVAYLVNSYPRVSCTFIRREIEELKRQGVEVTRFSLRGWDNPLVDADDLAERERTNYVLRAGVASLLTAMLLVVAVNPFRFFRALRLAIRVGRYSDRPLLVHCIYLIEACWIARAIRDKGLNHLHAHFGTNSATVAMLVGALAGVPWSFTIHGPEEFDKPYQIALGEKIGRCAFAVAVSSFGRSQLLRLARYPEWAKIHVVHCGIDIDRFQNLATPVPATRRLVCVGRLCEQKGQFLLVEAARILSRRGCIFELVLAGDGEHREQIEQLIAANDLSNQVRVTGWLSANQVVVELQSARALVLPSFAEGLPVVIMEAMALGRPVISTYVAGIPELVLQGEQGWLIPAGDVEALADAMEALLSESTAALEVVGTSARVRVAERHSVATEVEKLRALFSSVTGTGADQSVDVMANEINARRGHVAESTA